MKRLKWVEIGPVRLACANCLDVLPTIEAGSVDALIADPPYGMKNRFGRQRTSSAKWGCGGVRQMEFPFDTPGKPEEVVAALRLAFAALAKSAACFVWLGLDTAERYAAPAWNAGFTVKPCCWLKPYPPPAGKGNWWPSAFELAYYGYRKSPYFGDRDPKRRNVWACDTYRNGASKEKVGHPTQKPLRLVRHHVESIVPPGGLVLDPFLGSGTTAVACVQTGRRCVGIELDPNYFAIAVKRVREAVAESRGGEREKGRGGNGRRRCLT